MPTTLTSNDIGILLKEKYPNKIIIITRSIDHPDGDTESLFVLFDNEDELIDYMAKQVNLEGDIILYEDQYDRYIREDTLVEFDDDGLQIDLITYKYSGESFIFIDNDTYNMMKKEIQENIKMTQSEYYSKQ